MVYHADDSDVKHDKGTEGGRIGRREGGKMKKEEDEGEENEEGAVSFNNLTPPPHTHTTFVVSHISLAPVH